ncbi:MAG: FAD-binding protein [Micromonosporaceae bacterium]|nr:FAD-binding protein [Micromonosporaceae bacterium]
MDHAAARYAAHRQAVQAIQSSLRRLPPGAAPRIAKRTSNLFRFRAEAGSQAPKLRVADLDQVLSVDPERRTADVQGMVTYERLVDATLPHGLMPLVVPQLRTITLGGAVTGLGIESSSFRNGLPHESVLEMEILTGAGEIVTATPDNEHADLFMAFPNSYGTLGYALRLTIELEPVEPYVRLRHLRFDSAAAAMETLDRICQERSHGGVSVDFVDGVAFSPDELCLTLGTFADDAPRAADGTPETSDYTGMDVYYRSIQRRDSDCLTIYDYLWRWDTDWFWCSEALGLQRPAIRRVWPRRYRRSDVYRRLVAFDRRHQLTTRLDRWRGRPEAEPVIQDIEAPVGRVAEFLDFFHREVGISPVWLCPLRLREPAAGQPARSWPLYPLKPDVRYVNIGFWSSAPLPKGRQKGYYNRLIEDEVTRLDGHKSLYSDSYYSSEEFWRLYNGPAYRQVKGEYDPEGRLLNLYDKCVRNC